MEKQFYLDAVAPCSLLCHTCPAKVDGAIPQCARKLCGYFEGYHEFNERNLPEQQRAWLPEFDTFLSRLEQYANPSCPGCRNQPETGNGCIPGCFVLSCVKAHGVDFCGECPEFPCERAKAFYATVNSQIGKDWEEGSRRLRALGVERYFAEKEEISHYIGYKRKA